MGIANRVHVNDILEITNIRQDEILLVGSRRPDRLSKGNSLNPCILCSQQLVRAILPPAGLGGSSRAAVGRVVLEASILRLIVRRRDHDAVGWMILTAAIVNQNPS